MVLSSGSLLRFIMLDRSFLFLSRGGGLVMDLSGLVLFLFLRGRGMSLILFLNGSRMSSLLFLRSFILLDRVLLLGGFFLSRMSLLLVLLLVDFLLRSLFNSMRLLHLGFRGFFMVLFLRCSGGDLLLLRAFMRGVIVNLRCFLNLIFMGRRLVMLLLGSRSSVRRLLVLGGGGNLWLLGFLVVILLGWLLLTFLCR